MESRNGRRTENKEIADINNWRFDISSRNGSALAVNTGQ